MLYKLLLVKNIIMKNKHCHFVDNGEQKAIILSKKKKTYELEKKSLLPILPPLNPGNKKYE